MDQQPLGVSVPTVKLYRENAIGWGTGLFGPFVAGYMLAQNYKALGQRDKMLWCWLWAIVAAAVLLLIGYWVPDNMSGALSGLPVISGIAAKVLAEHFQGREIRKHAAAGGLFHTWGRKALVGLCCLVAELALLAGGIILFDKEIWETSLSSKNYGPKQQYTVYYDETNLRAAEVDKIAACLMRAQLFDEASSDLRKVVVTVREGAYEIGVSVAPAYVDDSDLRTVFKELRDYVQEWFPDHKIVILILSDGDMQNIAGRIEGDS